MGQWHRGICVCLMGSISFPCHGLVADKGMQQNGGYCCFIERDLTNAYLGITRGFPLLSICARGQRQVFLWEGSPFPFLSSPPCPLQSSVTGTKDAGELDVLEKQSSWNAPWSTINVCRRKLIECCVSKEITITIIMHVPSN